ncbi:RluA family pseudouridine synthase [Acetobacterium woodii]|uniref:RNA pseudouridylate synthase n=1 Tax=Acetobacterium woodii (strain ATCC 29683 / DSM 1030 / JCM 2381 / KCTC 1655 / WB1) TaxID=931626 RepID=H6LD50_ACEWD|nr:RluA family pseudouridine synthase [Acetobacterium woodii]AFA47889.1 ribosomal large subunit pseudouridine synthase C [Acetobacterium woodii DSM 1030]
MKTIVITENESNQRLDRFLKKLMPQASSGFLQKMLRKKRIKLNGQKSEPSTTVAVGDVIQIYFSEETIANFRSASTRKKLDQNNAVLDVVFENSDLLVLNKPAEILTQPDKTEELSLIDYAVDYLIKKGDFNPQANLTFTPACANRLDKNTTGIVLVPKNFKSLQAVNKAIREDQTKKIYYAIVCGKPKAKDEIVGYLKKDPDKNTVTFSEQQTSPADKLAVLNYETLDSHSDYALLKVILKTGRSHQIRVQLAAVGLPIIGDPKYGNRLVNNRLYEESGLKSQLLHSAIFTLTDRDKTFTAPLPYLFEKNLKRFGLTAPILTEK